MMVPNFEQTCSGGLAKRLIALQDLLCGGFSLEGLASQRPQCDGKSGVRLSSIHESESESVWEILVSLTLYCARAFSCLIVEFSVCADRMVSGFHRLN